MFTFLDSVESAIERFWALCRELIHRYDDILFLLFLLAIFVFFVVGSIWSNKNLG